VQLDIEAVAAEMATLQQRADALGGQRPEDAVVGELRAALADFGQSLPLLRLLAAPELRDRHWANILTTLGLQVWCCFECFQSASMTTTLDRLATALRQISLADGELWPDTGQHHS
jgi:Dynein heavy chain, N-terminal region 2